MRRLVRWTLGLLLTPIAAYAVAALGFALSPTNPDRVAPSEGVRIYVASNGVHTDLLVPRAAAGVDWRIEFPAADFRAVAEDAPYLGFGWGDRDFYMATRSWADLAPGVAWRAVTGAGPTVVKVGNYLEPSVGDHIVTQLLTAAEYHRLASHIRASLVRRADGGPLIYPGSGYGDHDVFYAAIGRYSALRTCNEWVAEGLRAAGLATPRWSPFAWPILHWMR